MRKKHFLRGLGLGVFITALILGLSYRDKMSDESVITRAKKLGMVFSDAGTLKEPTESKEPSETGKPENSNEPEVSEIPDITAEPSMTMEPAITMKPAKNNEPVKNNESEVAVNSKKAESSNDIINFSISRGSWSRKVSDDLAKLKLVDNADKFDDYLVKNGYAEKIKVGDFKIKAGSTFDEIANMITE